MIVFATCNRVPEPTRSLQLLLGALRAAGVSAGWHPWNHADQAPFADAGLVLPICCWDYQQAEADRFQGWFDGLEANGVPLLNPAPLLRWNFRKTYLLDVAAAGLAVPRSFHLPHATGDVIEAHLRREGWQSAVLKPVAGQGGDGVLKLDLAARGGWDLSLHQDREAMLQAFHPEIGPLGETTLVFVDGAFSHAIQRVLSPGEWRANHQYGVNVVAAEVAPDVVASARRYLDAAPSMPFYARVDGLVRPDGFLLMELEAIEPYFYFELAPGAAERFAAALIRRLGQTASS